ncbi:MAG TPA: preprotein translocase subunit YajC [Pyrinomonadaceae bacterium]|nr:preprotein translocase subunit YajC [Pyrinomonadaceae bacterium]
MSIFALMLQGDGGWGTITMFLPLILIFGIFYFLVIMPQRKKQQELTQLIANLKIGDRVVTNGGLIGKIVEVRDKSFFIRSADKSIIEVARGAVAGIEAEGN